jgi:hypothetical protein
VIVQSLWAPTGLGNFYPVINYFKITSCGAMIHDFWVLSLLEYDGCHTLSEKILEALGKHK